jgi:hypothetical protein
MQNTSIIAIIWNFYKEANYEDMTKKIGSIINTRLDMIFNMAIAI